MEEIQIGDKRIHVKNLRAMKCPGCEQHVLLKGIDPDERLEAYAVHVQSCADYEGPWTNAEGAIVAKGSDAEFTEEDLEPTVGPEVVIERPLEEIRDKLNTAGFRAEITDEEGDESLVEVAVMNEKDKYLVDRRGVVTLLGSQGAVVEDELNVDMVKNAIEELFQY